MAACPAMFDIAADNNSTPGMLAHAKQACILMHGSYAACFPALQRGGRVTYFGPLGLHSSALIKYLESVPGVCSSTGVLGQRGWNSALVRIVVASWTSRTSFSKGRGLLCLFCFSTDS